MQKTAMVGVNFEQHSQTADIATMIEITKYGATTKKLGSALEPLLIIGTTLLLLEDVGISPVSCNCLHNQ